MGKVKKKEVLERSKAFKDLIAVGLEKKNKANELLSTNKKLASRAKKFGINTAKANELIKKAQGIIENAEDIDDYDIASKELLKSRKYITDLLARHDQSSKLIVTLNGMIADMAKKGIGTTRLQKSLTKVKKHFTEMNYKMATELANKLIALGKKTEREFFTAQELIKEAEQLINESLNIEADIHEARELMKNAVSMVEEHNYSTAITIAKESIEAGETAKADRLNEFHKQTMEIISDIEADIEALRTLGADIQKPNEVIAKVRKSSNNNEMQATYINIELCKKTIDRAKLQHAADKIETITGFVNDNKKLGVECVEADELITEARGALKKSDFKTVYSNTNQALEVTKRARDVHQKTLNEREQTEGLLNKSRAKIKALKRIGIMVADLEALFKEVEEALEGEDFDHVQDLSNRIINASIKLQEVYSRASENIEKAKEAIEDSKRLIDPGDVQDTLELAHNEMKEGNYSKAIEVAIETINQLETIKAGKPLLNMRFPDKVTLTSGKWGKLQFEIENTGSVHARNIQFVLPDKFEAEGLFTVKILKAGESKTINFGLRTSEIGDIPMSIDALYQNPITNEQLEAQEVLWTTNTSADMGTKLTDEGEAAAGAGKPQKPEGEVKVLSELEFFQGYVRLKVGVKNEKSTVITDSKMDVEFDDSIMRLEYIEPEFQRKGNKIMLGNIQPNEKKTMAFYLDPLICTESNIDGALTYKDIYGELRTSAMKRRRAEVVCPILYTPENINTAMLKRLINDELKIHDSKIYEIPPGLDFQRAAELCKDTIQGHDLKFIREFIEHDIDDPEIETWYYGTTKVKKQKVVIKASSRKKTNSVELFAACQDKKVLTGFLAELGHNFNDKLKQLGITKQQLYPTTDQSIRNQISQSNTLLNHQYVDKTALSISKRGAEYEITFKTSEKIGEASELSEFIKISPGSRDDLISKIHEVVTFLNIFTCTRGNVDGPKIEWEEEQVVEEEEEQEEKDGNEVKNALVRGKMDSLLSYGQLLFSMFLPVPIQNHLRSVNEPIILKTNDNEVPWELLHDDNEFLCLKVPVGRRLRTREIPRTNPSKSKEGIRFLFIVNPTGDLESSEKEVEYIKEHLGPDVTIDMLRRKEATSAAILSAFRSGNYDIIHYAGHAEFNAKSPDESALISADKNRIFAQELKRIIGGKPFVFLNACSSGREKLCEDGTSYTGSDTEGLASSFILGGAMGFIGASWPLPDISAGMLASEFYNQYLKGESVGESLRRARLHLKNERPDDINWMAFTLFGDPTMKLDRS